MKLRTRVGYIGMLAALLTGCSSPPSAQARAVCSTIGQIGPNSSGRSTALNTSPTGDRELDVDIRRYLNDLRSGGEAQVNSARAGLLGRCADLGLAAPTQLNRAFSSHP